LTEVLGLVPIAKMAEIAINVTLSSANEGRHGFTVARTGC
jgi:hypothetical protein